MIKLQGEYYLILEKFCHYIMFCGSINVYVEFILLVSLFIYLFLQRPAQSPYNFKMGGAFFRKEQTDLIFFLDFQSLSCK